ncbi:2Fe-2S iron-sulfur cluster-binding protein [Brevibacillus sp. NRS-1366]|uniref:2Fe-2S iron-sulfur cluster-binding protein n=1 Tax=Brevibacillus sp. NRS-1366 TaxID=3233899 RepID=UPI003D237FED
MFTVQVNRLVGEIFKCSSTEDVLTAARRHGVSIPLGCRGGGCGMCKIQVTEGKFERGTSSMAVLTEEERKENYSLACKTYPRENITIEITLK